ncbi:hypothetical protein AB0E08_11025 [Streptomyces sp. NPDC048281]|uniref:hypothetical protein n=1 Tax=Streptomyces sp. NPDC048281 TaxID=3154715 RepID=UPI00341EEB6E
MTYAPLTTGPAAPVAAGPRPPAATAPRTAKAEASSDVRALLDAVVEAITLPYDAHDYERRLLERARIARSLVTAAFREDPTELGWNADYLRRRLAAEQAEADKRAAAVCASCHQSFLPDGASVEGLTRFETSPWCRWCVDRCRTAGVGHSCRICPAEADAVRRSVDRAFPAIAEFLATDGGAR